MKTAEKLEGDRQERLTCTYTMPGNIMGERGGDGNGQSGVEKMCCPMCGHAQDGLRQCCPTRGPRVACDPPANFKWPASVSLTFSNLCLKTEVTDKTWLNAFQFKHKSNPNDALNLFTVLKCTIRFRDSEASISRVGNEANIFITFSDGEGKKRLAHETSAKFLCIYEIR